MDGNQSVPMESWVRTTFQPTGSFEHSTLSSQPPPPAEIPLLSDELENRASALEEIVNLLNGKLARVLRDDPEVAVPALENPPSRTGLGVDLSRTGDRLAITIKELHSIYDRLEL